MKDFNFLDNLPNFSDESLKIIAFCPVCHAKHNPLQAQVVDEKEDAHLIHIKCQKCYSSILALVMANNAGISSIGLITDLSGLEVAKFKNLKEISSAELMEIADSLEKADFPM